MRFAIAFSALFWTALGIIGGFPAVILFSVFCVCCLFGAAAWIGGRE